MSTSNHPFLEFPQIKHPFLMMGKTIKWSPNTIEVAPSCPRCFSSNTKFCYYNNYSVSQPRYFCKACRRYWTKGGSLRNVPIGGGCRKGRRGRSASRHESPPPQAAAAAASGPAESGGDDARDRRDGGVSAASAKHDDIRNVVVKDYECGESSSVGVIDGGDEKLQQVHGCLDGRDFVYENFDVFEVEGIGLGNEMMWSNLEGFGCEQPLMEMQEFEVFSSDEKLMTDNWGSFDLSAYENF